MPKFLVFRSSLTFLIIALLNFSVQAAADKRMGAEVLNKNAYAVGLKGSLFQTTSYYDTDGTELDMAEGSDYQLMDLDFSVAYGISSSLEVTGFGRVRSVSSTANETKASNSGAESLGLSAKYSFAAVGASRYALGIHYSQTLYTNELYGANAQVPADEVILGDSGSEYGVDLFFTYGQKALKWDFKLGYNNPANDSSEEIVYKAEGIYQFSKLALLGGVEGIHSLKKDQFTDYPLLKPIQAVGASRQFNSINREKIQPYLGASYAFDSFLLSFKGATIIKGASTDRGNRFEMGIAWATKGITRESLKVEAFKEYIVDGSVLKVSARGNFLRIDQGLSTDVEKGMKFDIYQTDYFGGNVLVASGVVYDIGADWSVIKLTKKYNEISIKPGFAARGY